jgi:hypothetical protein
MNSHKQLQSKFFEFSENKPTLLFKDIDPISDEFEYDKMTVNKKKIFPEWNKIIYNFLLNNDFKLSNEKEINNVKCNVYISSFSELEFSNPKTFDKKYPWSHKNYNWCVRYNNISWTDKLMGLDKKSFHNISLFAVDYNFFQDDGMSDIIFDDFEKKEEKIIKDLKLSNADIKLLIDFVKCIIEFCQKWVDYIDSKEVNIKNKLKSSKNNLLNSLDKDGNGEVDVVEGNEFNILLKKHQKSIIEIDRNYVQQFIKVSSYLKTKKGNIQSIFNSIKEIQNQKVLDDYVEILKREIHIYNLILFNSLNMIVSLIEDDMITFYEIHEMFDTLNMYDSKHEKDVSQKLTNIGDGLESLMYEVREMGNKISDSIEELSYVTEQTNEQLSNQLSEIDSTMKVGNLISAINTYQNYKTNRRLNS